MLTFKEVTKSFYPLRWVQQKLIFSSALGAQKLVCLPFCSSSTELNEEYDRMDIVYKLLISDTGNEFYRKITHAIGAFRNISGTLVNIENSVTLSELELFEIKYFTYHYELVTTLLQEYRLAVYDTEKLSPVFHLLDPDQTKVVSFYLYDSYSTELTELRKRNKAGDTSEELYLELENVSYCLREKLTLTLRAFSIQLKRALETIGSLDLLIAKIMFAKENDFCRPNFSVYGTTSYVGLLNPYLSFLVKKRGEKYQSIDITLCPEPTLIIGANMSGKTMVLKSIALSQYLVQFGFYAPARKAQTALVDEIMLLIGDGQNEDKGLSSFGGEIIAISEMIESVYEGRNLLILLDEPARTTSPEEGVAIVDAVIELLSEQKVMSLVTTHYNKLKTRCRRLRVKGFVKELADEKIDCRNINRFIDYSLIESQADESSSEALIVARLLGVTNKLLNKIVYPEKE